MRWYVSRGGDVEGPFEEPLIAQAARTGRLPAGTLLCQEGESEWVAVERWPAFAQLLPQSRPRERYFVGSLTAFEFAQLAGALGLIVLLAVLFWPRSPPSARWAPPEGASPQPPPSPPVAPPTPDPVVRFLEWAAKAVRNLPTAGEKPECEREPFIPKGKRCSSTYVAGSDFYYLDWSERDQGAYAVATTFNPPAEGLEVREPQRGPGQAVPVCLGHQVRLQDEHRELPHRALRRRRREPGPNRDGRHEVGHIHALLRHVLSRVR